MFLFSFSQWNDNLSYTTISITKLDDISELGIERGIDLLGHAYSSEHIHYFDLESDFEPLSQTRLRLLGHSCSMWWGLSLHQWGSNSVLKVVGTLSQLWGCLGGKLEACLPYLHLFGHGYTELGDSAPTSGVFEAHVSICKLGTFNYVPSSFFF